MSEQWRPVEDGAYYGLGDVGVICLGKNGQDMTTNAYDEKGIWHTTTISNPENRRLCERIPDEPITAEALREGGWEFVRGKWLSPDHRTTHAAISVELATGLPAVVRGVDSLGPVIDFPNVRNMGDLRTLVRLLSGGGEP